MLTRLRVSGFKNLVDVDVRFGPFTCVAGANGIGKSNLFDAIHFLSLSVDRPLIEAAREVRGGRTAGALSLFQRVGTASRDVVSFEVEMIVPPRGRDEFGYEAEATITFLCYRLTLGRRDTAEQPLEILEEELRHIPRFEAHKHLAFKHSASKWRDSVITGERRAPYFLSTTHDGGERFIQVHQDGSHGRPVRYRASQLPRTVLSRAGAAESPTALLVRREMRSWRLLQLEPSALRRPDELTSPDRLGSDGSHLAAALYRLVRSAGSEKTYDAIASRLAHLVDDVRSVHVDRDDQRGLLTLRVIDREGTEHPAPSMSDGSLRFLALAVLELDRESQGLICLEEPENGVHPERIPAMLELLHGVAADVHQPAGDDNPLRQVIVNTHSPAVVAQVPEDSLLVALHRKDEDERLGTFRKVELHPLPDTWRAKIPGCPEPVPFDRLLAYLNPTVPAAARGVSDRDPRRRVMDREDVRQMLIPFGEAASDED